MLSGFAVEMGEDLGSCRVDYQSWLDYRMIAEPFGDLVSAKPDEGWFGRPALEEVTFKVNFNPDRIEVTNADILDVADWHLYPFAYPVLKVDMNNPDAVILDQFKKWLTEKRKGYTLPIKRRGPQNGLTPEISKTHFSQWAERKIVALWDLDFWAKHKGIRLTNVRIFNLIYPGIQADNLDKYVSESRSILELALDLTMTIEAQAASQHA